MPVWHASTRELREDGRLALVGIVQEQHPERAELFGLWKDFDFPVLWDPFGLTGSHVVPRTILLDGQGVVRALGVRPEQLPAWLDQFEAEPPPPPPPLPDDPWRVQPEGSWHVTGGGRMRVAEELDAPPASAAGKAWVALAAMLFEGAWTFEDEILDRGVEALRAYLAEHPDDAAMRFRLGVALRLRMDRGEPLPGDFQAAVDAWREALARRPDQYIWRRRLQQYGPRLDQPYPFYDWVADAQAELAAAGVPTPPLGALTEAERVSVAPSDAAPDAPPDPAGTFPRDDDGWVRHESTLVFDTSGGRPRARVHLALIPDDARDVHWNNETGPLLLWLDEPPAGWTVERRGFAVGEHTSPVSAETRGVDFEVELPADSEGGALSGYAIFQACEGDAGTCIALRHDVRIEITR